MKYQYRWYYASVISIALLLMLWIYDLNPLWTHFSSALQEEKRVEKKLAVYRNKSLTQKVSGVKNASHASDSSSRLADILALVTMSGMVVESVHLSTQQTHIDNDFELIHLVVFAQFHQATAFFYAVTKQTYPVLITNFSYKTNEKNIFLMTMNVLVWKKEVTDFLLSHDDAKVLSGPYDPFCHTENTVINREDDAHLLRLFTLAQMKMHGYLQQGEHSLALILLPNNSLVAVQVGAVMGSEHAIVTAIFQDHTQLLLPNKQKKILALQM